MKAVLLAVVLSTLAGCKTAPAPRCAGNEQRSINELIYFGTATPDGAVTIAFHPHHLSLQAQTPASPRLTARTQISEITGSESFVHVDFNGVRWVMLAHGIHDIDPDTEIAVFLDTRHLMAFGPDGRAIATGSQAA